MFIKLKKILSLIIITSIFASIIPYISYASVSPSSLISAYDYSYTYVDVDFDDKETWNDTVNFNQLGYSEGTGTIDISSFGVGSKGNSARLRTNGSTGEAADVLKVSFDFLVAAFSGGEIGCDLKFGTWYSGLHIKAHPSTANKGAVTLWGTVLKTIDPNSWHNITYIIDSTSSQYTLYIDNEKFNTLDFTGEPSSVQIAPSGNSVYIDNAIVQVLDAGTLSYVRSVTHQDFDLATIGANGWIDKNLQVVSGYAELADNRYNGASGKSLSLSGGADFRFFLDYRFVSAEDAYGETTQINLIRADISSGIAVYSMDFLFDDFLTQKAVHINSLLENGSYSWNLGGLYIPETGTGSSHFVTTGVSSGVYSKTIYDDTWYNIKIVVDLGADKIYFFLDDELFASASHKNIKMLYRMSVSASATACSEMYLDNVNITAYSTQCNTPSVFESDDAIRRSLSGYSAIHMRSGCIVNTSGEKTLAPNCPYFASDGKIMVDSYSLTWLVGKSGFDGVYTETLNGVIYYSLTECINACGKHMIYNDSSVNGGFCVIGSDAYSVPSGTEHKKLNDYLFFCRPDTEIINGLYQNSNLRGVHPRIYSTETDFDEIRELTSVAGSDDEKMKALLLKYADMYAQMPAVSYTKNNGDSLRMNDMASTADTYMYTLANAWQITKNTQPEKAEAYAAAAWKQLKSIASFPDWNPAHHIDHGIFSSAFSIGYDMMYDAWNDEQRAILEEAALRNGLSWYMKSYQLDYTAMGNAATVENNHNSMTNGNAILLSLAFMDVYPQECSYVLSNAMRGLEHMIVNYVPEGGWSEGVFYSSLNLEYLCPALACLENIFGSCLGLDKVQGFDGAGDFIDFVQSDVGIYNFADADFGSCCAPFWYQTHFGKECARLYSDLSNSVVGGNGKLIAQVISEAHNIQKSPQSVELDKYFTNAQLVTMHDSYNKGQAFVGIKAGDTIYAHSHFDSGSFVYDWNGVRWAHDMGKDDYNLPDFWDNNGGRWKIFLNRAESHNTVIVDPDMNPDYKIGATAPISFFETSPGGGVVKVDTSDLYSDRLSDAKRAFCFTDNRKSLVVRDELKTLSGKTSEIYWMMYTQASAQIDKSNNRVILTDSADKSKRVMLEFVSSHDFDIIYEKAEPLDGTPVVAGQKNNAGFYRLALKTSASGNVNLTVKLTPVGLASASIEEYDVPISSWDISMAEYENHDKFKIDLDMDSLSSEAYGYFALYNKTEDCKELIELSPVNLSASAGISTVDVPFKLEENQLIKLLVFKNKSITPAIKAITIE